MIHIDNTSHSGNVTAGGTWNGIANTVTAQGADCYFEKIAKEDAVNGVISGEWSRAGIDSPYKPGTAKTVEIAVPLTNIGSPASGDTLKVFAAVSIYWYDNNAGADIIQVKDIIPAEAGQTSTSAQDNDTLSVDMAKALSYTIR